MKIHISRQGIVIRTVEVKGDKASVGSGADCDIRIDDPYLSAHVADLVNRGGEWRIVDAATSIEGLTHNGRRVEDEPMVSGERYGLGAFELVAEGAGPSAAAPPPASQAPQPSRSSAPVTMMQSFDADEPGDMPAIPRTMFEASVPGGIPGVTPPPPPPPPPSPQSAPSGFQPMGTPPPPTPQRPAAPPPAPAGQAKKRSKLPLLLAVVGLMFVLVLIVGVMMMGGGEEPVATETAPAPTPVVTDTAPKTAPEEQGNQFASRLEIDSALEQWEAAIQAGGNEPLRARYAQVALDAAMVHAAANDTAKSRSYLERVVKFGPPDSPEVEKAKARLDS